MKQSNLKLGQLGKLAIIFMAVLSLSLPTFGSVALSGTWVSGTSHTIENGNDRALIFIAHGENKTDMNLASVTYGGQAMTKVIEKKNADATWCYVVAYILKEADIAAASNDTFVPTWVSSPNAVKYSSLFLQNVGQITPIGNIGTGAAYGTTVITSPLDTNNGDMVILASTYSGQLGSYALNNGFIEGVEQAMATMTGVTGHKAATGVAETPSATFTGSGGEGCQGMIGFVVQIPSDANIVAFPNPANGARNVSLTPTLSWSPGVGATSFDVYFGTDSNARNNPKITLDTNSYSPSQLLYGTKYYWAVDCNNSGTIYPGPDWYFSTLRMVDPNYQIATWSGFKMAAVSYTFDDQTPSQFTVAVPMFNEFDYDATFYPVISWGPNWDALRAAASAGHEVGSHTVTHRSLGGLSITEQTAELVNSQNAIDANIPTQSCVTLAYPNCSVGDQALTAQYYIGARICNNAIESNTPANIYQIGSLICGSQGVVNTPADFNSRCASAATARGWCVFLIHAIDGDSGFSPLASTTLRSSLQYLDARRNTFWVDTFGNVVRYIRERNDMTILETSNDGTTINLQVTHTLDGMHYNYPISVRRPLPAGWQFADVSQNGEPIEAVVVDINSVRYVEFEVVPNGGTVVLSEGLYGDFTGNGIVDTNDLPALFDLWLNNDCNQTVDVDLYTDADCMVNFYEFAAMAENWMMTN